MSVDVLVWNVGDEVAPFLLLEAGLAFVVDDGGGDAARDGPEDEPVAGGEAYAWEACNALVILVHASRSWNYDSVNAYPSF